MQQLLSQLSPPPNSSFQGEGTVTSAAGMHSGGGGGGGAELQAAVQSLLGAPWQALAACSSADQLVRAVEAVSALPPAHPARALLGKLGLVLMEAAPTPTGPSLTRLVRQATVAPAAAAAEEEGQLVGMALTPELAVRAVDAYGRAGVECHPVMRAAAQLMLARPRAFAPPDMLRVLRAARATNFHDAGLLEAAADALVLRASPASVRGVGAPTEAASAVARGGGALTESGERHQHRNSGAPKEAAFAVARGGAAQTEGGERQRHGGGAAAEQPWLSPADALLVLREYAWWRYARPDLLRALCRALLDAASRGGRAAGCGPEELLEAVRSCAWIGYRHEGLLAAAARALVGQMRGVGGRVVQHAALVGQARSKARQGAGGAGGAAPSLGSTQEVRPSAAHALLLTAAVREQVEGVEGVSLCVYG